MGHNPWMPDLRSRLGRIPDPPDVRDHPLSAHLAAPLLAEPLPSYYYARPYPTVLDQGDSPMCVGFSGASYRATEERIDEKRTLIFDGPDLYRLAKEIDGDPNEEGTYIRAAAIRLADTGGLVKSSPVAAEVGVRRKISSYARLLSIPEILAAVRATGGAWLGSTWYDSWFDPVNGVLPAPDVAAGGHAYRVVGWRHFSVGNVLRTQLRCLNSWGTGWAQKGLFWMPASFVDFSDFDCWTTIDVRDDIAA